MVNKFFYSIFEFKCKNMIHLTHYGPNYTARDIVDKNALNLIKQSELFRLKIRSLNEYKIFKKKKIKKN